MIWTLVGQEYIQLNIEYCNMFGFRKLKNFSQNLATNSANLHNASYVFNLLKIVAKFLQKLIKLKDNNGKKC